MTPQFTERNWYKWYYGESEAFAWPTPGKALRTEYGRYQRPLLSFHEALTFNAAATVDYFGSIPFDLLFSGGVDSELMLRAYLDIGHPVHVNIIRFENSYNAYDVDYATRVCEALNVTPTYIDFNLAKFYENDALDLMESSLCSHARAVPHLKFVELVDGLPMLASGDPRFYRPHDDYSVRAEWLVQDAEYDLAWYRHTQAIGQPAIMQWLKWTPGVIAAMTQLTWFKELTNDMYPGKLGPNSTKLEGYREAHPDLLAREKRTGLESAEHLVHPVQQAHNRRHHEDPPYSQTYERTVTSFLEELWGTSEN
jgi:hypothetical protein